MVMLVAILTLVLAASVPALAEIEQSLTQAYMSGTPTNNAGAVTTGVNPSGTCAAPQEVLNVFLAVGIC